MNIVFEDDSKIKSEICENILRSLPQWFGIESAIVNYIQDIKSMETWIAIDKIPLGFLSIFRHNKTTAEIHVMGVLPAFHRKNIGRDLVRTAELKLRAEGFKYLTVKTLSDSRPCVEYDQTRKFYFSIGFLPLEEFKTLWSEANPCLMLCKNLLPVRQYMGLEIIKNPLAIARLTPDEKLPEWALRSTFYSVTKTRDELSIVSDESVVPHNVRSEGGWRGFRVSGVLDFGLTGVLTALANPLADAGISIFVISTFDTDYILVKGIHFDRALEVLKMAGHTFKEERI